MIHNSDNILDQIGIAEAYERCTGYAVDLFPKCGKTQHLVHCPDLRHPPKRGAVRDAHPSCALDVEKNVAKCFSCGYKSGILGVVIASGKASSRPEAITWLRSAARTPALPVQPAVVGKRGFTKPLRDEIEAAHYDYVDESGHLLYRVIRKEGYNDQNAWDKRFLQCRPYYGETRIYGPEGAPIVHAWIYHLGPTCDLRKHPRCICHDSAKPSARVGVEPVPYHLPNLPRAREQGLIVFVPEGEKCADAMEALGFIATTPSGGAHAILNDAWKRAFRSVETAVVLADADIHGRRAAQKRTEFLSGYARRAMYADIFPERNDGYDIFNWIDEQHRRHVPNVEIVAEVYRLVRISLIRQGADRTRS